MNFLLAGSPIEARQNPFVYTAVLIGIILIIILLGFNVLLRFLTRLYEKNANNPNKPTTRGGIARIGKKYQLTKEERNFLWCVCRSKDVPNFEYQIKSDQHVDDFFKNVYSKLSSDISGNSASEAEKNKSLLFSIREKIEQQRPALVTITNTKNIPAGQKMYLITSDGSQYSTELVDNTAEGLVLLEARNAYHETVKPPALSKITLYFETKNNTAYTLTARIIRYQQRTAPEFVTAHTNNIESLHRRSQRRLMFNPVCSFTAVSIQAAGNAKNVKYEYKSSGRKYEGRMLDISSGGCSMQTDLDIKDGQYIHLDIQLDAVSTDSVVGIIVSTSQTANKNQYILHIRFVKMSRSTKNKIFAKVYDYE